MDIEFDAAKRLPILNDPGRGLDIRYAGQVFDQFHLTRFDEGHSEDEDRYITVGLLDGATGIVSWTSVETAGASSRCGKQVSEKDRHIFADESHPDDAKPELGDDWFAEADGFIGEKLVQRGRPRAENPKRAISIRLDAEVIDWFRKGGQGWQTRINRELRRAAGLPIADRDPAASRTA